MPNLSRANKQSASFALPVAAVLIAATIFVVDSITHPEIAVAPLYAAVVLLVVRFLDTRGVLLVSAGCMLLAVVSALLHDRAELSAIAFMNLFASLSAIVITTYLVLQNQSSNLLLLEQARLLDVTHDAIVARNMQDIVTYWNQGAEGLYGWSRDEAIGQLSHQLLKTEFPIPLDALEEQVLRTGRWEGELLQKRRDGTEITVASRWAIQLDSRGNPVAILETNNDITARKQAQEMLQKTQTELAHVTRMTTLGELVASIAHEVNQPMAAIVANGEASLRWLDRETPNLEEARRAIARIISEGMRASDVISRIRELSRKGHGRKKPQNLNEIIEEVIPLVQRAAVDRKVSLQLDEEPRLPEVLGDRVELQQVIINLLMNALEATEGVMDRPRELLIRTSLNQDDGVELEVRDSGTGISEEHRDRLFSPFFTTKAHGMGMGLSICRSIIQDLDGRIWASRNPGAGTTMHVSLPAHRRTAS
jgi:two-component system sensor kinase FixL